MVRPTLDDAKCLARSWLSATLRRVRRVVTYEVTHVGEPVALQTPVAATRLERLEHAGELSRAEALVSPLRRFRPLPGRPMHEIISADRG